MNNNSRRSLAEKKIYIHPMTQAGARLIAAAFRAQGFDACILPPSDTETLEIGAFYSAGDECFPSKITMGDYLKVTRMDGFDPARTAFMMPTANGPCRFGQYRHLLGKTLKDIGLDDIEIVEPSSEDGYSSIGGINFFKTCWIGLIASDIIRKMLLKTRPYEKIAGTTNNVYERSLQKAEKLIEIQNISFSKRITGLRDVLVEIRDDFRTIDANYVKGKPLIAVVGEIFCRHNRFANENMIVKLEQYGAETWLSDVGEWVFYTEWSMNANLIRLGKTFSKEMLKSQVKKIFMKNYEHKLLEPFHDDFVGYEEPSNVSDMMKLSEPYLPPTGALGEMSVSIGRSGYCYKKGVDGIVDISPFSCMNGIVTEAVYPSFSKDHNNIPCRVFYYDGIDKDLDRDIGIYMELVKGYMNRKTEERRYNRFFHE